MTISFIDDIGEGMFRAIAVQLDQDGHEAFEFYMEGEEADGLRVMLEAYRLFEIKFRAENRFDIVPVIDWEEFN
jgi:hypothetical protein